MESKEKVSISIVIPVYNEEKRIAGSLQKIRDFVEEKDYDYEVIVSDDGSRDKTIEIVETYQKDWEHLRLVKNKHKGKAPALISGINSCVKEFVLFSDVDLSVSIEELPKMLNWLMEHDYDIAIATREGTGAKRINEPFTRHLMGRVFNLLVQLMVLPGINDTQCGFKVFKTESACEIFRKTKLYTEDDPEITGGRLGAFDVEILFVAKELGYKIKEVPVTWVYGEDSKVHKLRDSYINAMDVFKVRLNSLKGAYK